jgi:cytochrome bd-type quinol oxidase subunit 2
VAPDDRPTYVPTYTVVLFLVGVILLTIAWVIRDYPTSEDLARDLIPIVVASHLAMGLAALLAGVLRTLRAPGARVATLAASVLMILWIPTGTALFAWWLLDVRRREAPD